MTDKGQMIEAVYKASLTKRATLVIFYLINRANKELTCFPGIKTIAADCNMSDRTVRRALDDLIECRFVLKESRYRENGGQSSNLYTLSFSQFDEVSDFSQKCDSIKEHSSKENDSISTLESVDFYNYKDENSIDDHIAEPVVCRSTISIYIKAIRSKRVVEYMDSRIIKLCQPP